MIVTSTAGGLELVTQPDHARLAGDILALWRVDGMPEHPRRRDLLLAVREHDNGWREEDAAPRLDAETGRPLDFRRFPRRQRFVVWRRALDRLTAHPYAAALVAHHALEIHRDRASESWGDFRREIGARRDEALQAAELGHRELAADYRFLELCDAVSLTACGAFDHSRCRGYSFRRRGAVVELDPFPLAGATTFRLPTRTVEDRPYDDAVELVGHLAAAPWERRPVRLAPPAP